MSERKKAGHTPRLCFVGIDGKRFIIASTGMCDMIGAAANRTLGRDIDDIEYQWSMYGNRWMQTPWGLPRAVSHTADELSVGTRGLQRQTPSVACDRQLLTHQAL